MEGKSVFIELTFIACNPHSKRMSSVCFYDGAVFMKAWECIHIFYYRAIDDGSIMLDMICDLPIGSSFPKSLVKFKQIVFFSSFHSQQINKSLSIYHRWYLAGESQRILSFENNL